jgi:hypothetical protein
MESRMKAYFEDSLLTLHTNAFRAFIADRTLMADFISRVDTDVSFRQNVEGIVEHTSALKTAEMDQKLHTLQTWVDTFDQRMTPLVGPGPQLPANMEQRLVQLEQKFSASERTVPSFDLFTGDPTEAAASAIYAAAPP